MYLREMIYSSRTKGYSEADAEAKVSQDLVLRGIAESSISNNVTIKGGVVMRSLTGNVRRATQDLDIDFIRYSLSDDSIDLFVHKINCVPGITIRRIGKITELNQQDYHGKSIRVVISDAEGISIESKIDLGVHNKVEIKQDEYCFDIAYDEKAVSLRINSMEQMFTEKLRSLLKFGVFSTRYKDVYDMFYYKDYMDDDKLKICLDSYVFFDDGMREKSMDDIINRIGKVFQNKEYKNKVDNSDKRWIDDEIDEVFSGILKYLKSIL